MVDIKIFLFPAKFVMCSGNLLKTLILILYTSSRYKVEYCTSGLICVIFWCV